MIEVIYFLAFGLRNNLVYTIKTLRFSIFRIHTYWKQVKEIYFKCWVYSKFFTRSCAAFKASKLMSFER